ncbi:MAG: metallopeptidase TldD-related protein, partial [Planctomycetota bacterium]
MSHTRTTRSLRAGLFVLALLAVPAAYADEFPEANDTIFRALIDELNRSMTLQLEDLEKPYFIQYGVNDTHTRRVSASYGAIVRETDNRSRRLNTAVRVGSKELDNTNFGNGGGFGRRGRRGGGGGARGGATLPLDNDYTAMRQAIWGATDGQYKSAVETLTEKKAYMEDRESEDRPDDFADAPVTVDVQPKAVLITDDSGWRERVRRYSGLFAKYAHVTDSSVSLRNTAANKYLVNSDGTRLRTATTTVQLQIRAQSRAADGRTLSDGETYLAASEAELPSDAEIVSGIEALAARLLELRNAPVLDHYFGPVLFDGIAACQVFQSLLAQGFAAQPVQVGGGRRRFGGSENLERRMGRNILPAGFQVFDDPREQKLGNKFLAGHYRYDDDGVAAQRVDLIEDGRLVGLVMSRVPSKTLSGSTGHGRGNRGGANRAALGCLYITGADPKSDAELTAELIAQAKDQGLEFALRVKALSGGAGAGNVAAMMARFRRGGGGGG